MSQQDRTEENRAEQAEAEAVASPTDTAVPKADAHPGIEKLQLENADLRDKLLRWQADFANLQRRTAREVLESQQRAEERFTKDLLSVLDHLDAALTSTADYQTLFNGVKITNDEFKKLLTNRGIESFDPTGQPFDPHQHEAVMQEASDKPAMTVLQTFQPGYKSADRVLRPAKVKVSK